MDLIDTGCVVFLCLSFVTKKRNRVRKYWVHLLISPRTTKGHFFFKIHLNLREHPEKSFGFYRMSAGSFDQIL